MAKALIREGADVNVQDNLGMTPLMEATFWDKVEFVKLILNAHPKLNLTDFQGNV